MKPIEVRIQTGAGPSGPYFHVMPSPAWAFQALYWRVQGAATPSIEVLEWLTSVPGFSVAYRALADDVFWQSERSLRTYELYERSHRLAKKVKDPDTGEDRVDISQNPGRRSQYPGMWLQSSWQMWFGAGAFRRLPVTRLRDFPHGHTKVLASGAVFIQLYDDPATYDCEPNRKVQAAFREWSGMNELERRALDAGRKVADPSFEIEDGVFPHGGRRLLREWRDARGEPIERSKASEVLQVELDETGSEVWRQQRSKSLQ